MIIYSTIYNSSPIYMHTRTSESNGNPSIFLLGNQSVGAYNTQIPLALYYTKMKFSGKRSRTLTERKNIKDTIECVVLVVFFFFISYAFHNIRRTFTQNLFAFCFFVNQMEFKALGGLMGFACEMSI